MSTPEQTLTLITPQGEKTLALDASARQRPLSQWLREHVSLPLNTRCGERGLCDGCLVELVRGRLRHVRRDDHVQSNGHPLLLRGCEYAADDGDLRLRLPSRSLQAHQGQVVTQFKISVSYAQDPLCRQIMLDRAQIARAGGVAAALDAQLGNTQPVRVVEAVGQHGDAPHEGCYELDYRGDHWRAQRRDQPRQRTLGAAVDIGTTTVALFLVDLDSGRVVGKASGFNRQIDLGDNVVTRINLCATDRAMIHRLRDALNEQTLAPLLEEALRQAEAAPDDVAAIVLAGNTTMLHLAVGMDPSPMGIAPFTPAFLEHRVLTPEALALPVGGRPSVHLLPSAAAYVGADITAGIFASGLIYDDGPSLLVDVGTNGEIVLKHGQRLLGCATAAGPAFEGSGLSAGTRAGPGAVERITFDPDTLLPRTRIIDDAPPIGICGSAYIDFLAEARRMDIIDVTGRFTPAAIARLDGRLVDHPGCGRSLHVVDDVQARVTITEADIARLLQAKAAIAAGILTLLDQAGIQPDDVRTLYLAGGFGLHIDARHAIGCGLLPGGLRGFRPEQVRVVGNTALAGAYLTLLDHHVLDEIRGVAQRIDVIELNLDPQFESTYIDQLMLPESP